MTVATAPQVKSLKEKIEEYEGRLEIGWNKLRGLELNGKWDERMFNYWLDLLHTYELLCKSQQIFMD